MIEIYNILDAEKYLEDVDAVIFDLDDTLYSEMDYVKSGYQAIAEVFVEFPKIYDELWESFLKKEPAIDVVFEKNKIISRKEDALHIYRFHKPSITLYSGVEDMLDRISKTKKIGIITDGRPEGQHAKLEVLGLTNIPYIITDELGGVQFRKPCVDGFVLMLKMLDVSASNAVYIGDNLHKDEGAPKVLNMKFVYFHNTEGIYYNS